MNRIVGLAVAWAVLGALACTDVSGNSTSVLSMEFDSLAAPSVVLGDTLRDSTGTVATPVVRAYNFKGELIDQAPVRFQSADAGVFADSITGVITADSLRTTPARIIASVGSLQAVQKINVTLRPDLATAENGLDSLQYSLLDTTLNVSPLLTVKLTHGIVPADSVVSYYMVSFAIVSPGNPLLADLVTEAGKMSRVDTTDTNGIAGRAIRLHPVYLTAAKDSIIVNATVKFRGMQIGGSPVRLVLKVRPRT